MSAAILAKLNKAKKSIASDAQPATGGVRKPRRWRAATIALGDCHRTEDLESKAHKKDPEFKLTESEELEVAASLVPPMLTRAALRTFYNVGANLPVLEKEHQVDEEADQFNGFLDGVHREIVPQRLEGELGTFYESEHASW